jgi:DNA polymerase III epsilon subunit-like protein
MPANPVLTFCACIDPRRIDPATGHYPNCPDEIIPPECLLPPWDVKSYTLDDYVGKGARSDRYPNGKPIYEKITRTDLAPGRAWTEARPVSVAPAQTSAPSPVSPPSAPVLAVVLDTETTGISDPRVCEIALAIVDLSTVHPKVIAHASKLVNPGRPIPPEATRVHGITDADVANCPSLADVWPKLLEWVGKHAGEGVVDIIAHNASYDRKAVELSLPLLPDELPPWRWHCSMLAARRIFPDLPSHSLHDDRFKGKRGLASSLGLTRGESHRALGDVKTTVSLLGKLCEKAGLWHTWRGEMQVGWGSARVFTVKGKAAPAKTAEKPAPEPAQSLDLFAGLNSHQTARRPA